MDENYLEFGGSVYYIDLNSFDKLLTIDGLLEPKNVLETETTVTYSDKDRPLEKTVTTRESQKNKEINIATYETVRMLLEIVLTYSEGEEVDDTLGAQRALQASTLSFKIAFNTLLRYNIIKEL
jgi:hypothetical protein